MVNKYRFEHKLNADFVKDGEKLNDLILYLKDAAEFISGQVKTMTFNKLFKIRGSF